MWLTSNGSIRPILCFYQKKRGLRTSPTTDQLVLIHAIAKVIAKMIATRLVPLMNELVSKA
jgi:hypothetical protein